MAITKTPRLNQTRWSSGQDPVKREDFDSDAASAEANSAIYKEGPLASRPSAGVHGRFYTVTNDIDPTINGRQYYDNGTEWKVIGYTNNQLAESISVSDTALTVRAQNGPTADIFEVQTSDKSNVFRVTDKTYTTNQQSVGASGGVRFGYSSSHDNAGLMISVGKTKPVLVIQGAADQSGNLLELKSSNNSYLARFNASGGANFVGDIYANSFFASESITTPSLNTTGDSTLYNATVKSAKAGDVALSVIPTASQTANLIELFNASGVRAARVTQDGTVATDGRVLVGGGVGNSGSQSYSTTTGVVSVRNTIGATTPVLNLYANTDGQTGKILQTFDTNASLRYWIDAGGNTSSAGNMDAASIAVGAGSNTAPTKYYNSVTPRFEVITGTSAGSYDEAITIRHPGNNSTATNRRVGVRLKVSDESSQNESNKWGGISAGSSSAKATDVSLYFYSNGQEAGNFDPQQNLNVNGDVVIPGSNALVVKPSYSNQVYLYGKDTQVGTLGMQTANTAFVRADQFAIYSGGTYNSNALNSGGGSTLASFTADRTTLKRLTLSNPSSYDSTSPVFQIGTTGHMQFSNYSINCYDDVNNTKPAEINLANNGGRVRLGNTSSIVSLPSRLMYVGNIDDAGAANAMLFARSSAGTWNSWAGRGQQNGDWWFDHTTNTINVHDGTKWHVFHPDETSTTVGGG